MKAYLLNWSFMRILRLLLGGIILVQGIMAHEVPYAIIGGLLALMAFANIGCSGGACSVPVSRIKAPIEKSIDFDNLPADKN